MHKIFLNVLHIKYFKDSEKKKSITRSFFPTTKRFNGAFNSCLEKHPTISKVRV